MLFPKRQSKAQKLSSATVAQLRTLHAEGKLDVAEAADLYGVGRETIRRALRGETHNTPAAQPAAEVTPEAIEASVARLKERLQSNEENKAQAVESVSDIPAPNPDDPYNFARPYIDPTKGQPK